MVVRLTHEEWIALRLAAAKSRSTGGHMSTLPVGLGTFATTSAPGPIMFCTSTSRRLIANVRLRSSIVLEQAFLPLDRQFDSGHRSLGDAFHVAADALLEKLEHNLLRMHGHMPVFFLYRHALELYLKSSILTVHRALRLPTEGGVHTPDPRIRDLKGNVRPLHYVHSLLALAKGLDILIAENQSQISLQTSGSWRVPAEMFESINRIENHDQSSTYFRYPTTGNAELDAAKSGMVAADPREFLTQLWKNGEVEALDVPNVPDGVELFVKVDTPLETLMPVLSDLCETMAAATLGLYGELVVGVCKPETAPQPAPRSDVGGQSCPDDPESPGDTPPSAR